MQRLEIDPQRWPELTRLLDTALELSPAARSQWIDALDHQYDSLKPHLRNLLARAAQVETDDFLNTLPKLGAQANDLAEPRGPGGQPGEAIGPYRLLRELGAGGMGSVWLAERTDGLINRPVALKLPHGAWKRAGLAERMAREREILATLNHPHIARLYDAGVAADGQPFLALEYVEGRWIDAYCRDNALDLRSRLRLFVRIARAVAYAHGKLVIHRDLKPANILVTTDGHVRLLDFGIAKLIEEEPAHGTQVTELSGRALTPDYASPELIRGEALTIASDVYSLGVLLFELLTDARPYALKRNSRGALEDAILQVQPAKPSEAAPSARRRALRGDLDTIVLTALKKTPEERYSTVNALVEDIERHLDGRAVLAQPDSSWYRLRKFVGRNRLTVSAAGAVIAAVLIGSGIALWQARLAIAEKERAEEVKEFVVSIFRDADPYAGSGRTLSGRELLSEAHSRIQERFGNRRDLRIELLQTVGASLASLGDLLAAESALRQALAESSAAYGAGSVETLRTRVLLTEISNARRDTATLRRELQELLPSVRQVANEQPELLVRVLKNQSNLAFEEGRRIEAEAPAREAFEIARRELGSHHPLTVATSSLIAETYLADGRAVDEMLAETERALNLATDAHRGRTNHASVIRMREVRGRALAVAGRFHEAVAQMRAALEGAQQALGESSVAAAYAMANIAPYERRLGDLGASLRSSDAALAIFDRRIDRESADYAFALTTRGVTLTAARRAREALADLTAAEAIYVRIFGAQHWDTLTARFNRAVALAYLGRFAEAHEALAPARDPATPIVNRMWVAHVTGVVNRLEGNAAAAIAMQREAERLIAENARADWDAVRVLAERGLAELANGDAGDAADTLTRARDLFVKLQVRMYPAYAEVIDGLERAQMKRAQPVSSL